MPTAQRQLQPFVCQKQTLLQGTCFRANLLPWCICPWLYCNRDVVQPPVFVTAAHKRNEKAYFHLVMYWPVASAHV